MSGSLGGGRSQRQQVQAVQNPMTQDLLKIGMQYSQPAPKVDDGGGIGDILKLLEKYWKIAL